MNTNQLQSPEIPTNLKALIHSISILLLPIILVIVIPFNLGKVDASVLIRMMITMLILDGYIAFLYYLAGGFEWKKEKLPTMRIILFWVLGDFIIALFLFGFWLLIRLIMTKVSDIPMSSVMGRLHIISQQMISQESEVCWFCKKETQPKDLSPQLVDLHFLISKYESYARGGKLYTKNAVFKSTDVLIPCCKRCTRKPILSLIYGMIAGIILGILYMILINNDPDLSFIALFIFILAAGIGLGVGKSNNVSKIRQFPEVEDLLHQGWRIGPG